MELNNKAPVKEENGLLALIVGKPIEMVIGGMATIILLLTGAIYHDGHSALTKACDQMDALEKRVSTIERMDATQNADLSGVKDNIKWIAQYGLVPKEIREETLPNKK